MLADGISCNRKLMSWFENEFLDAPVQDFCNVQVVFGGAGDFVGPAELSELLAGFAEDAEKFSIEREFVDAAGKAIGTVEDLIGGRRDANGPGRAGGHGAGGGRGLVADGGACVGIDGNIDDELAEKFSVLAEDLDAAVAPGRAPKTILRVKCGDGRGCGLPDRITGLRP